MITPWSGLLWVNECLHIIYLPKGAVAKKQIIGFNPGTFARQRNISDLLTSMVLGLKWYSLRAVSNVIVHHDHNVFVRHSMLLEDLIGMAQISLQRNFHRSTTVAQ